MATHGEIWWPPLGRNDGRLQGDFHGRRHVPKQRSVIGALSALLVLVSSAVDPRRSRK